MNEDIALYQKVYAKVLRDLQNNEDVLAAFVFGSILTGDLWERSDIDFILVMKKWEKGMTNVYSDYYGKLVHFKIMSRREFMNMKSFDQSGSFLHRLLASSRLVHCTDKGIEQRFNAIRPYPDLPRKTWTLTYLGKVLKGLDSVKKSQTNGNNLAAYATLIDTLNYYAMVLINHKGYIVSKDNINIATDLFDDFSNLVKTLMKPGDTNERVEKVAAGIREEILDHLHIYVEVLYEYFKGQDEPKSAKDVQSEELFEPYHVEMEAVLALLHERGILKKSHRQFNAPCGKVIAKENVYCL